MTQIHHLILSDHEVTIIQDAARTLGALTGLAASTGIQADKLSQQHEVLSAIEWRLRGNLAVTLTPDPEPVTT